LEGCIADRDRLLRQAFKHLVPNGYIELQGVDARLESDDGTIVQAPNAQLWMKNLREACTIFGKPADGGSEWEARLTKAGFVDVHQEVRKVRVIIMSNPIEPVL
jgi:hypothetical protein